MRSRTTSIVSRSFSRDASSRSTRYRATESAEEGDDRRKRADERCTYVNEILRARNIGDYRESIRYQLPRTLIKHRRYVYARSRSRSQYSANPVGMYISLYTRNAPKALSRKIERRIDEANCPATCRGTFPTAVLSAAS